MTPRRTFHRLSLSSGLPPSPRLPPSLPQAYPLSAASTWCRLRSLARPPLNAPPPVGTCLSTPILPGVYYWQFPGAAVPADAFHYLATSPAVYPALPPVFHPPPHPPSREGFSPRVLCMFPTHFRFLLLPHHPSTVRSRTPQGYSAPSGCHPLASSPRLGLTRDWHLHFGLGCTSLFTTTFGLTFAQTYLLSPTCIFNAFLAFKFPYLHLIVSLLSVIATTLGPRELERLYPRLFATAFFVNSPALYSGVNKQHPCS